MLFVSCSDVDHSDANLQVCYGLLCCCMTRFWPSFSCQTYGLTLSFRVPWYTEEFMVHWMTAMCPGPVDAKQPQTSYPAVPCLMVILSCLDANAGFSICQTRCCALGSNNHTLIPSVCRTLFSEFCDLFRCCFASHICAHGLDHTQWGFWGLACSFWVFLL